jgi:hypothetical protein
MRRLLLFTPLTLLLACDTTDKDTGPGGEADADTDTDADTDADADTDTDTDTDTTADTALAFLVYEGHADFMGGAWEGSESWVAYDVNSTEWCRVTNPYSAPPADTAGCPDCEFAYDAVFEAGTATGSGCAGVGLTGDLFDGEEWIYGWAPSYTYVYGGNDYTYDNALLFDYSGVWYWWAYGYTDEARTTLDYRGLGYSVYYYYYQ